MSLSLACVYNHFVNALALCVSHRIGQIGITFIIIIKKPHSAFLFYGHDLWL